MTLNANASGIVTGKFTIPPGITAGNKRVQFSGSGGSTGQAIFSGQGELIRRTQQQQTTVTETRWQSPPPPPPVVWWGWDPLAQTFSVDSTIQVSGVDLWFTAKGTSKVVVEIRETTVGLPNQTVVASKRLNPADITLSGHTRINFDRVVTLLGRTEYAIVVMCDDAVTSLAIAELGKWEPNLGRWVTSQPYQVGVLLSSANASAWTPHQDRDLAFRLLRAGFTGTSKTVDLGTASVTDATDLMMMSFAEIPAAAAGIEYRLTMPGGEVISVVDGQPIRLASPVTGTITMSAVLSGTSEWFPVLHPGIQLVVGTIQETGDYVTRAIKGGADVRVKVVFDANIPGGSSVAVKYKGGDVGDTWATVPYVSSTVGDDGFMEMTHEVDNINEAMIQIKLELTGTTAARPRVRNLRFMTI